MYLDNIDKDMNPGVIREDNRNTPNDEDYGDMHIDERPKDDDEEAIDKYLSVELIMNMGTNDERRRRVIQITRGLDDEAIGCAHANPLFDTREYEVKFTDGTQEKYQAQIIAENMFAQVDTKGNQYLLSQEILTDHKSNNSAILISKEMARGHNGGNSLRSQREDGSYW
jgi:hypothetical protein